MNIWSQSERPAGLDLSSYCRCCGTTKSRFNWAHQSKWNDNKYEQKFMSISEIFYFNKINNKLWISKMTLENLINKHFFATPDDSTIYKTLSVDTMRETCPQKKVFIRQIPFVIFSFDELFCHILPAVYVPLSC